MPMFTSQQLRSVGLLAPVKNDGKEARGEQAMRRPAGPVANKTEAAYAKYLDMLKMAGEVKWWMFQPMRLRIATGDKSAYYRPDFLVQFADGHFEFHETKGFERQRAMLALKVASGMFLPFRFVLIKKTNDGWSREEF